MPKKKIPFNNEDSAKSFAKIVNGEVKDLRPHPDRKSDFKVVFEKSEPGSGEYPESEWSPETGHDFGYSNEYWN